jgi:hypothetical protein
MKYVMAAVFWKPAVKAMDGATNSFHWEKNDGRRRANKRVKDIAVETLESARLDPISGGKHRADMAAAQIV